MKALLARNSMVAVAVGVMMVAAIAASSDHAQSADVGGTIVLDRSSGESAAGMLERIAARSLSVLTMGVSPLCVVGPVCV